MIKRIIRLFHIHRYGQWWKHSRLHGRVVYEVRRCVKCEDINVRVRKLNDGEYMCDR